MGIYIKKFCAAFTVLLFVLSPFILLTECSQEITSGKYTMQIKALTTVAEQYKSLGALIQYDQNRDENNTPRRSLGIRPEKITTANPVYMDCSSYICNVFFSAIGMNIGNLLGGTTTARWSAYMREGFSASLKTVPFYHEISGADNAQTVIENFSAALKYGDIIVYRYTGADGEEQGHTMLWTDENKLLHAAGQSMPHGHNTETPDSPSYEQNGAVQSSALSMLTSATGSRYLYTGGRVSFGIIRLL